MNVYFMGHGTYIKIGKACDPEARLRQLQTGTNMRLRLLAVAPVGSESLSYEIERKLHEQFAWSRRRGEFFRTSLPLRHLIAAVASGMDVREAMKHCEKLCRRRSNKARNIRAWKEHNAARAREAAQA